jgi:hypothetical protein
MVLRAVGLEHLAEVVLEFTQVDPNQHATEKLVEQILVVAVVAVSTVRQTLLAAAGQASLLFDIEMFNYASI